MVVDHSLRDPQQWQSQASHLTAYHQEVLKLKQDIEHRLQKQVRSYLQVLQRRWHVTTGMRQVLALRRVVADVEGSASRAVVSSVKLHNSQRYLSPLKNKFVLPLSFCRFQEREDEIAKLSNNVLEMNFILARLLKQDEHSL